MIPENTCQIQGKGSTQCPFAPTFARIEEQMRQVQEQLREGKEEFKEIKETLRTLTEAQQQATGVVYTARALLVAVGATVSLIFAGLQFWKNH
ncbi:MAG: hypothetical protein HQL95_00585 [Magnetococcales bacterium]|nr:hypothetical protein [Magnetococcales bacterium]